MVLAVQLFNRIKKNLKKYVSLCCSHVRSKIHLFLSVLDIYITRNGNNLKLKVKSEFSLSIGLMLNHHKSNSLSIRLNLNHHI